MDWSEIIKKRVVYALPGMEQSLVRSDLIYKSLDEMDLRLDVYYPPGFTFETRLPAVIFIHGDGPAEMIKNAKNMGQYVSLGQLVAASGLIAIPFNHRSSEERLCRMADVASDIQDLIEHVRAHAEELSINGNRLCVWACSAGVPYLGTVMETTPEYVRCLVAYYGRMNFQQWADRIPPGTVDQEHKTVLEIIRKFSLLYHLMNHPADIPPMLIAQAELDDPALNETIRQFVAEATAKDAKVDLVQHPGGHHAFDLFDEDERSRLMIKQTLAFIQQHLQSR